MDDSGIPRGWDDIDDWIRREVELLVRDGCPLAPTLAISFVGDRPDIFVEPPTLVQENWSTIVDGLIDMFGSIRPERLVVAWPNMFSVDDIRYFAARLNLAEKGPDRCWSWRTRLHPYVLEPDDSTRIGEWGNALDVRPPDPASQQLRRMFTAKTHHRLLRRGWFKNPPHDDWDVAVHPDSTTFANFDYLPGVDVRNGRLVPAEQESSAT